MNKRIGNARPILFFYFFKYLKQEYIIYMSECNNGGIFMSCYSFTKILNAVDPSDDTIYFLIKTHHKYLMVKNAEYNNVHRGGKPR